MELLANEINRLNKLLMDYIHENENLNEKIIDLKQ